MGFINIDKYISKQYTKQKNNKNVGFIDLMTFNRNFKEDWIFYEKCYSNCIHYKVQLKIKYYGKKEFYDIQSVRTEYSQHIVV